MLFIGFTKVKNLGVPGSKESITSMREAETMFTMHRKY